VIPRRSSAAEPTHDCRVLWDEFFGNHDWPVASAVRIAFLLLLVGPIAIYHTTTSAAGGLKRGMERGSSAALFTVLFFGIAPCTCRSWCSSVTRSRLAAGERLGWISTAWYAQLLHNRPLLEAALLSLEVAVFRLQLCRRARYPGGGCAGAVRALSRAAAAHRMVNAPLVMPEIITGITQLLLFVSMVRLLSGRIAASPPSCCRTSPSAPPTSPSRCSRAWLRPTAHWRKPPGPRRESGARFLEITLPIIAPAIISSWLLCFTLSLDDLVISSFVAGPGASTLPMVIYSKVKLGVSPDINALASLIVCAVGVCIIAAGWLVTRSDRRRALETRTRR